MTIQDCEKDIPIHDGDAPEATAPSGAPPAENHSAPDVTQPAKPAILSEDHWAVSLSGQNVNGCDQAARQPRLDGHSIRCGPTIRQAIATAPASI